MQHSENKSERIAVRVTPGQKALLAKAASIRGRSLTDYVVDIAQRQAEQDIEKNRIIELSSQGQQQLADLLGKPPKPNKRLKAAAKTYDETNIISR